jgi:fructokinase
MLNITTQINALADRIHALLETQDRVTVGIAGAPGSGKSTLASELARRLNQQKTTARVLTMDGFHLDNSILEERGMKARKGAPETFDAMGFVHLVRRIQQREHVYAPIFDRARDISIAGAQEFDPACSVVICEGNYLLLDEAPWRDLADVWDISAWLDVALPELRARLIQRWLSHGLSRTAALHRAEGNDLKNAQRIMENLLPADITLA